MADHTIKYGKTQIQVLYENSYCLVLNKPSGLSVQGGEGIKVSLDSILVEKIRPRPFLVHRLDRDTSGIILVAKTKEAAAFFPKAMAVKRYLALCSGTPRPPQGVIDFALDRKTSSSRGTSSYQESTTTYRLLSSGMAAGVSVSLVELELGTGRMHQIRRHLAMKNHPVLGDDKYGDFPLNKNLRKTAALKHLLLHASSLTIPPSPGLTPDGLEVTAPLPDYFANFMKNVELKKEPAYPIL